MEILDILPSSVEIKYNYIKIDGTYISTIVIIKYENNIELFESLKALMSQENIEITFHIKRENNFEIIKKLTNVIAESGSEISSISNNQIDINIIDNVKNKAIELRKKIQIDNEQIYSISIYIVLKENSLKEIEAKTKEYINKIYAKQIIAKPSNFRQKQTYIASLPLACNMPELFKYTHNIFTEEAIAKLFPFFEEKVLNKNGILLGNANNNLCAIDIFNSKNNNYNMCIFGASGAGKSYFVKLMIIKNAYKGIRQIVIDPEGEYVDLVKQLGGQVYDLETYNPFEIDESYISNDDFLSLKIKQILDFIEQENDSIDKELLKKYILELYNNFGINENKESLYLLNSKNRVYIKPKYIEEFPTMQDFWDLLAKKNYKDIKKGKVGSKKEIIKQNTELYCFNLKGKNGKDIEKEMKIFIPKVYELIKPETLIYFDEVWKSISLGQDRFVIENIYNMFKTLRKKKAGIVTISQDICDLFALDNGNFGKSILNNANIKVLFKMEWQDVEMLTRMMQKTSIGTNIKALTRGNAYISLSNTNFNLEVKATEYEHKLIEGESYEKSFNSNE